MNLQHLRYFLAVARTGGFTQAARQMNVTQPTVSSAVSELEKSMGVQLFNRDNRHVALTTEGRLLLSYAVQVEDLLEEASERLQRTDLEPGGGFQFGAVDAAVIYLCCRKFSKSTCAAIRASRSRPKWPPRVTSSTIC